MTNKSKDIGTKGEMDVVRWLIALGYEDALRRVTAGALDPGDVEPIPKDVPPVIISVKSGYNGKKCETCKKGGDVHPQTVMFEKWWARLVETVDRRSPSALGLMVHKRYGKGSPQDWHWYVDASELGWKAGTRGSFGPVKITGEQAVTLLKRRAPVRSKPLDPADRWPQYVGRIDEDGTYRSELYR